MGQRWTAWAAAGLVAAIGCSPARPPAAAGQHAVAAQPPPRLVVLADPHVDKDPKYSFFGVAPAEGLAAAVRQINDLAPAPAEVVVVGDLARRGREEDYHAYLKLLSALKARPVRHLLGNHDKIAAFRKVVLKGRPPPGARHRYAWDFGTAWRLLALDSRGKRVAGKITPAQIRWFEAEAAAAKDRNVLVFLHHDPARRGMTGIQDSKDFLAAVDRHRNVRAIVFGHRHELEFRTHAGRVHLVSAPPTAWPFRRKHPRGWLLLTPAAESLKVEFVPLTAEEPTRRFARTLTWK